jgi:CheY-like chemotaxis protein
MKKIIIARSIMYAMGGSDSFFGRGTITTYPARTSEEILNIHGARQVDLIITEDSLPMMGSARLCVAIRNDALLKNVSIIIVTDAGEKNAMQWREAGANAVIARPLDPVQLFSKISELIVIPQRKELRAPLRASVKSQRNNGPFCADSRNISLSGMLLETDRLLEKGDVLSCTFRIAHSEISADCTVTRVDAGTSGKRWYGVKFLNCSTKSLVTIEHFIKSQVKQ